MTKELWFDSQHGQQVFLFSKASRSAQWPTQPCTEWMLGAFTQRWNDVSSSAEVKNECNCTSTPPCAFMACQGTVLSLLLCYRTVYFRDFSSRLPVICMCIHPDQLWCPLTLLFSGHQGLFPCGWSDLVMKLATQHHTHMMQRLSVELLCYFRVCSI